MKKMSEPIAVLNSEVRRTHYSLELGDDYLVRKWRKGKESGERRISLDNVMPEISVMTARPEHSRARVIGGLFLVGLAIVVFFSTLQQKAPLLFALLALLGGWILAVGLRNFRLQTWTIFHEKSGEFFAHVVHSGCDPKEREEFETIFRETMAKHKQRQPTSA
jgi:hypothetical protein